MKPTPPASDSRRDLETLLRKPVTATPPSDSADFAARVLREALRAPAARPAPAPRHGPVRLAAAAALALAAGLTLLLPRTPARPGPAARVSAPDIPSAAAVLPGAIENAVRNPYDRELARLREDVDRTTRFVVHCAGFDLAGN
ncbi:MAG: hypothetical protein U1F77_10600 [Kiritimatiellia bacterium]